MQLTFPVSNITGESPLWIMLVTTHGKKKINNGTQQGSAARNMVDRDIPQEIDYLWTIHKIVCIGSQSSKSR